MTCIGFALGLVILNCTPMDPAPDVARYCQLAKLVRYSRTDTAETRRQIREANATYRKACGG